MANYELEVSPFPEGPTSHGGYRPLPTQELPPPYEDNRRVYPPPAPAVRAPPTVQQQQSSNVVVVGNQPTPVQQVSVMAIQPANDHLTFTVLLFVLCLLLGNIPLMLCLFPALIFSIMASTYNDAGEIHLARRFGSLACKCNIASLIPSAVLVIAALVIGIVILMVFLNVLSL